MGRSSKSPDECACLENGIVGEAEAGMDRGSGYVDADAKACQAASALDTRGYRDVWGSRTRSCVQPRTKAPGLSMNPSAGNTSVSTMFVKQSSNVEFRPGGIDCDRRLSSSLLGRPA